MNKQSIGSLLAGIGLGVTVSGLAISLIGSSISGDKIDIENLESSIVASIDEKIATNNNDELMNDIKTLIEELKNTESELIVAKDKLIEQEKEINSLVSEVKDSITTDSKSDVNSEEFDVYISSTIGATEISKILQSYGVVDNADNMRKYIGNNGKTKALKHGQFKFKKNMSYEEALNILMRK